MWKLCFGVFMLGFLRQRSVWANSVLSSGHVVKGNTVRDSVKDGSYVTLSQFTAAKQELEEILTMLENNQESITNQVQQNTDIIYKNDLDLNQRYQDMNHRVKILKTTVRKCIGFEHQMYGNELDSVVIPFEEPFDKIPAVVVSLTAYDDEWSPVRFRIYATPTTTQLTLVYERWSDSKVKFPFLTWLACA